MHTPARARHLAAVEAQLASEPVCAARDPLRAVRRPPDPHSLMAVCFDGLPASEEALRTAITLARAVGTAAVDLRLIGPLAYVPLNNLITFKRRGGQILFAKSYLRCQATKWTCGASAPDMQGTTRCERCGSR